jgi:hypothetical protein
VGAARSERLGQVDQRVDRRIARGQHQDRPARRGPRTVKQQARVLGEDLALELPQVRARLEPHLVHQPATSRAVGLERLGLASVAVQREHELGTRTLAQREGANERLQLPDEAGVASEPELRLDTQLGRRQPQVL